MKRADLRLERTGLGLKLSGQKIKLWLVRGCNMCLSKDEA